MALPSAFCRALGKFLLSVTNAFVESRTLGKELHSVKISLPSAKHSVKAALGKGPSAAVYNWRPLAFAERWEKVLDKEVFTDVVFAEPSLPSATLGKAFSECFSGFAECLRHSTKHPILVVTIVWHIWCSTVSWLYLWCKAKGLCSLWGCTCRRTEFGCTYVNPEHHPQSSLITLAMNSYSFLY
jgi:hypothetical protein